jgi:hypothetical protein
MRDLFMTVSSRSCRYFNSKGIRIVRSPFVHGVLIGSAIVALLFLAL